MKKTFLLALFCITVMHTQYAFDSFMGGGGDPFAGFGGDMDFGSLFGGGDSGFDTSSFDGLFGGGGGEDAFSFGDEGDDAGFSLGEVGQSNKPKPITPPEVTSAADAFNTSIDAKVNKLTPFYKKALSAYLTPVCEELHALITHLASLTISIAFRKDLKEYVPIVHEVSQLLDTVATSPIYHITLLTKPFENLRKKLMHAAGEKGLTLAQAIGATCNAFTELAAQASDSLDEPTSDELKQQKEVFKKTKHLAERSLKPLIADLKKLIGHKDVAKRVETKKKKYAAKKVSGSFARSSGGWSDDASSYFNDGRYGSGGYGYGDSDWSGSNGWGGGNYYGNSWDSSDSWGRGFGSNWGSSGSSGTTSNASTKASPIYMGSSGGNGLGSGGLWDENTSDTTKQNTAYTERSNQAELDPQETLRLILSSLPSNLKKWNGQFAKATSAKDRLAMIQRFLHDRLFYKDAHDIAELFSLYEECASTLTTLQKEQFGMCIKAIESCMPCLMAAVTYASPPFTQLAEEQRLQKEGATSIKARQEAQEQALRRTHTYKSLLSFLSYIREHRTLAAVSTLYEIATDELLKKAHDILVHLELFLDTVAAESFLTIEQTTELTALSRQFFHEPVGIAYADALAVDTSERITALKEHRKRIGDRVVPLVQKQKMVADLIITITEQATTTFYTERNLSQDEEIDFSSGENAVSFSTLIEKIVDEQYGKDEHYGMLRSLLLPYEKQKYRFFEVQHALLQELAELWLEVPESRADAQTDIQEVTDNAQEQAKMPEPEAPHDDTSEQDNELLAQGLELEQELRTKSADSTTKTLRKKFTDLFSKKKKSAPVLDQDTASDEVYGG